MPEPVSKVDIEDVLSSIRRLVSEDARIGATKPTARSTTKAQRANAFFDDDAASAVAAEEDAANLMLTPALRVAGSRHAVVTSTEFVAPKAPVTSQADANFVAPRRGPSALGAADGSATRAQSSARKTRAAAAPVAKPVAPPSPAPQAAPKAAPNMTTGPAAAARSSDSASLMDPEELRSRIAALESVIARQGAAKAEPAAPVPQSAPVDAPAADAAGPAPAPDSARAGQGPGPQAPAAAAIAPTTQAAPRAERPIENDDAIGNALLNEELLRVIVREMLEEQLQGAMGERVTRSLRRLIRQELQNLLAPRDTD